VASGDPGSPQDPAADAAVRAEKPPEARGDGGVRSKGRIFTPDGKLVYANVYSTDPNADQKELFNFANVVVMPRLRRINGMDVPRNLVNRISTMRIRRDPDRMRAHNVSSEDIMKALTPSRMIRPGERLDEPMGKVFQLKE
jgi:multidrug efflux pump subunit AcrB